jgi:hypothetical protein
MATIVSKPRDANDNRVAVSGIDLSRHWSIRIANDWQENLTIQQKMVKNLGN